MYKRFLDTIPESRKLGSVSDFAFRCWAVGLTKADWFGRLTAEPDKFKLVCFPNRPAVTPEEIEAALDELADAGKIGLVHLYRTEDGERILVYHKHEDHNPSGSWKTKRKKYPPPPKSLCRCVKFQTGESPKSVVGSSFRFAKDLFSSDQSLISEKTSDHCTGHAAAYAPLFSSPDREGGVGGEEGEPDKMAAEPTEISRLCDEFTSLTGRVPLAGIREPRDFLDTMKGLIKVRGIEPMIVLMRTKTRECQDRTGRPPSSLQYFVPIFQDDRLFNGKGAMSEGTAASVEFFSEPRGAYDQRSQRRIAAREREGAERDAGAEGA